MNIEEVLNKHELWLNKNGGECANLCEVDFRCIDLSNTDLRCANLSGANLRDADLSGTDLRHAELSSTNLCSCSLRGADLRGADLYNAIFLCSDLKNSNLTEANLNNVIGNSKEIKSIFIETWPVIYTKDVIQIGCQQHKIEDWWKFSDKEIDNMGPQALYHWRKYNHLLKQIIEMSPAD